MDLVGSNLFLVGIKGTGMAALAELLLSRNNRVTGSDVPEKFYTDEILTRLRIPYNESFSEENIDSTFDLVIYSSAYNPETQPELRKAKSLGVPILSYPEALGSISRLYESVGIAGVHGKTTTTALAGTLTKKAALPATVLTGSSVSSFGDSSVFLGGDRFFLAETCEYRRNFLFFSPFCILLTSVEPDHLDYYRDYKDILSAFVEYGMKISDQGILIYCCDDPGAREAAEELKKRRRDITYIPYGFSALGEYRISSSSLEEGFSLFSVKRFKKIFKIAIPGEHTLRNAAGALALATLLFERNTGRPAGEEAAEIFSEGFLDFRGSRRRSEILGEASGILFMDDYAHHPTAIKTTLEGLKSFYPRRRLVVDFMSHTYSRTKALFDQFAESFGAADLLVLHKIYSSAREKTGDIGGEDLFRAVKERREGVFYFEEILEALPFLERELKPGDLFITLGAGNNWELSRQLYNRFKYSDEKKQGARV